MPESPRVGLVGCGRWGRHVCRDLVALGCQVTVVASSTDAIANARAMGAHAIVPRLDDLPHDLDGYVVVVPVVSHAEVVLSLLPRGKPIYCEKPLAATVDEGRAILAAGGDRVFVMEKWRYHPGIRTMADLVRSGRYGQLVSMHARRVDLGNNHDHTDILSILAPHDLSILWTILGRLPEPVRAVASPSPPAGQHHYVVWFADPVPITIEWSYATPRRERSTCCICEDATLWLGDAYADAIEVFVGSPTERFETFTNERVPVVSDMPLLLELQAFRDYLLGGPPPMASTIEGLAALERIDRIRALAGTG